MVLSDFVGEDAGRSATVADMNIKEFLFMMLAAFLGGCVVLWIQRLWCRHENEARRVAKEQPEIGFHAMLAETAS